MSVSTWKIIVFTDFHWFWSRWGNERCWQHLQTSTNQRRVSLCCSSVIPIQIGSNQPQQMKIFGNKSIWAVVYHRSRVLYLHKDRWQKTNFLHKVPTAQVNHLWTILYQTKHKSWRQIISPDYCQVSTLIRWRGLKRFSVTFFTFHIFKRVTNHWRNDTFYESSSQVLASRS